MGITPFCFTLSVLATRVFQAPICQREDLPGCLSLCISGDMCTSRLGRVGEVQRDKHARVSDLTARGGEMEARRTVVPQWIDPV